MLNDIDKILESDSEQATKPLPKIPGWLQDAQKLDANEKAILLRRIQDELEACVKGNTGQGADIDSGSVILLLSFLQELLRVKSRTDPVTERMYNKVENLQRHNSLSNKVLIEGTEKIQKAVVILTKFRQSNKGSQSGRDIKDLDSNQALLTPIYLYLVICN